MKTKEKFNNLREEEINRIIEMAWEDRTPFDAIESQFGISEGEVIKLMRRELLNLKKVLVPLLQQWRATQKDLKPS